VAAGVVSVVLTGNDGSGGLIEHAMILLLLAYPCINLGIQRFHDRGKSGWWVLLGWFPIIWVYGLVAIRGFLPSSWGSPPLWLFQIPLIGSLWYLIEAGFLRGTKDQTNMALIRLDETVNRRGQFR
jgi:uncharacterized membrane protein YhaH (DUF805 family)